MVKLRGKTNHPIIVLEGPDGAGKTSLAEALQKKLGARYVHLTYRFKDKMHLYHGAALRFCARVAQDQPVILDRWWPSEIVYADAYRGGSTFAKYYLLMEHIASKIGLVYVMCLPEDREQYLEHFNKLKGQRVEMYNEGLNRVYDGYSVMYSHYLSLKENVYRYDMFENFAVDSQSREIVMSDTCQNVLEFTEDYRSTLNV